MNGAMSAVQPADCSSGRIGDRDDNVGDEVPLVPEFGSDGVVAGCSGDGLGDGSSRSTRYSSGSCLDSIGDLRRLDDERPPPGEGLGASSTRTCWLVARWKSVGVSLVRDVGLSRHPSGGPTPRRRARSVRTWRRGTSCRVAEDGGSRHSAIGLGYRSHSQSHDPSKVRGSLLVLLVVVIVDQPPVHGRSGDPLGSSRSTGVAPAVRRP